MLRELLQLVETAEGPLSLTDLGRQLNVDAPVLEANLINYLWPLCIILFTPLLLPGHPLRLHHLLAGALGLAGSVLVMVDGSLQLQQAHLPGYLLALEALAKLVVAKHL